MAYRDFRQFLRTMEKHGEVQRIKREVNWNLELGAIERYTAERGLKSPFFEKVKDYPGWKASSPLTATMSRVAISMELNPDISFRDMMMEYIKRKQNLVKPIVVKDGPCKENIFIGDDVNLFKIPAPMLHDGDGGRYFATWHANVSKDPDTDWVNWGMLRVMIRSKNTAVGLLEKYRHMGMHLLKYEAKNEPMPFALAIGMDPICSMMACSPIQMGISEVDMAGAIRKEPVELIKCETNDLLVPATSELVVEGEIMPGERDWEGPFGEWTGYRASPKAPRPVYRVKAITHRNDPIYVFSCMGMPVDDGYAVTTLTAAAEYYELLLGNGIPVEDVRHFPHLGQMVSFVKIRSTVSNMAQRVGHSIFGSQLGLNTRWVIVVEDDVDMDNIWEILHDIFFKCHPLRGVHPEENTQGWALMPSATRHERLFNIGASTYVDCTWPLDWDPSIAIPPKNSFKKIYPKEIQDHVLKHWSDYGYEKL